MPEACERLRAQAVTNPFCITVRPIRRHQWATFSRLQGRQMREVERLELPQPVDNFRYDFGMKDPDVFSGVPSAQHRGVDQSERLNHNGLRPLLRGVAGFGFTNGREGDLLGVRRGTAFIGMAGSVAQEP